MELPRRLAEPLREIESLPAIGAVGGFDPRAAGFFFGNIYLQRERVSFLDPRARGAVTSLLSEYTPGKPEQEPRCVEVYGPYGIRHQVRACLHSALTIEPDERKGNYTKVEPTGGRLPERAPPDYYLRISMVGTHSTLVAYPPPARRAYHGPRGSSGTCRTKEE